MTIEYSADLGSASPRARTAPGKAAPGRFLRCFLWGGSAVALFLTLAAAAMPALFALGGEGLDPASTVDLGRAMGSLTLAHTPSPLAPKSGRLQRLQHVQTPPVAVAAPRDMAPAPGISPDRRLGRLIAPPSSLRARKLDDAAHRLDRADLKAATRFAPLLLSPDEEDVAEDRALAEAKLASEQPDVAQVATDASPIDAEADAQLAALVVPRPTFRPLLQRSEAPVREADKEDEDDEASAPRRRAATPPRMEAPPRRQAPSPVMAYARPDAGALRIDPSAVDTPALRPKFTKGTAYYDISASIVYLPNGERLEAHSGLGRMRDNPRFVREKNRGPTPPHTYNLTLRESLFHGVQAIRLTPVGGERKIFNRNGLLAHTYMLGPRGDSNGCVSFRDYKRFLAAFRRGEIRQLVVVERMDSPSATSRFAWLFGKS